MMIRFACKNFTFDEFLKCSLGLTKSDYKLFNFLLYEERGLTTKEISKKVKLDRTTVQKSIKGLVDKNIVLRFQENLKNGGYLFRYQIKDKSILKKEIIKILDSWSENAEREIEKW